MSKTVVLWDIDDTLNVHGAARWPEEYTVNSVNRREHPSLFRNLPQTVDTISLRMSSKLNRELSEFDLIPEVENHWITAWQDLAHVFASKMGMPFAECWNSIQSEVAVSHVEELSDVEKVEQENTWWKTLAVRQLLTHSPETKVVWIDDMLDHTDSIETGNVKLVQDYPDRLLLVGVLPQYGVTPDVLSFVRKSVTSRWRSGLFIFEG